MTSHPSPIEPDGLLDGLQWGSILLGAVVDNVLTVLGFGLLTASLAGEEAFSGDEEAAERAFEEMATSPEFLLAGLLVGVCATAFGAFVGARRAGVHHVQHGGWIAVCSAALSLVPILLAGQAGELCMQLAVLHARDRKRSAPQGSTELIHGAQDFPGDSSGLRQGENLLPLGL